MRTATAASATISNALTRNIHAVGGLPPSTSVSITCCPTHGTKYIQLLLVIGYIVVSYAMVATFDIDPQQVFQANFLQELLSRSTAFTLADGERRVQDVVTLDIR
jgi:hypothetical protein